MVDKKQYLYSRGVDARLDEELSGAPAFSKVRPGERHLFWKSGFRWYAVPFADIQRIYRRVEQVVGRLCCGGKTYVIEWLVLVLRDGREVVLHIGDEVRKKAENLMVHLENTQPQIAYGKVYE